MYTLSLIHIYIDFEVILTPGHTVGGVSYLSGESLFSGDTLFAGAVGRTDMPGGSLKALKKSLKRLIALPNETKVYPGPVSYTHLLKSKSCSKKRVHTQISPLRTRLIPPERP